MQKILLPKGDFIFFPSGDANVLSRAPNIPTSTDSEGGGCNIPNIPPVTTGLDEIIRALADFK